MNYKKQLEERVYLLLAVFFYESIVLYQS